MFRVEKKLLSASRTGHVSLVQDILRDNPNIDVNQGDDTNWSPLMWAAGSGFPEVVPLLLAHPGIDVNQKSHGGWTPFYRAALNGHTSCVRLLLKDSRVLLNERTAEGGTAIIDAASKGHIDVKWWIASGREMNLGEPGDVSKTDAIGIARKRGGTAAAEVATLLERFLENPGEIRHALRLELGEADETAAEMFALVVFVSDGLLDIKPGEMASRFFRIATQLPLELQMVLCFRLAGSGKVIVPGRDREQAFRDLVKRICGPY